MKHYKPTGIYHGISAKAHKEKKNMENQLGANVKNPKMKAFLSGVSRNPNGTFTVNAASTKQFDAMKANNFGGKIDANTLNAFMKGVTNNADGTMTVSAESITVLKTFIQDRRANKS